MPNALQRTSPAAEAGLQSTRSVGRVAELTLLVAA